MAFLIKSNQNKEINVRFEDRKINIAYVVVDFNSFPDGETIDVSIFTYETKDDFLNKKYLYSDIPDGNFHAKINKFNQTQSIEFAYLYTILRFESMGYECELIDYE